MPCRHYSGCWVEKRKGRSSASQDDCTSLVYSSLWLESYRGFQLAQFYLFIASQGRLLNVTLLIWLCSLLYKQRMRFLLTLSAHTAVNLNNHEGRVCCVVQSNLPLRSPLLCGQLGKVLNYVAYSTVLSYHIV